MRASTRVAVLLSAVGVGLSIIVITAIFVRVGLQAATGSSAWILIVAGIVPGLAAGAILLLGSPPPRTPWAVHIAVIVTIAGGLICGVLGGIINLGLPIEQLSVASVLFLLAALGLLFGQLFPPENRVGRWVTTLAPLAIGLAGALIPALDWLFWIPVQAVNNLAIGLVVISPLFAVSALVTGVNRARKERAREQAGRAAL
jgi:hypothetical protein